MDYIPVKQSCNCGDMISMIPALRQLSIISSKKILIYQRIGMVGAGMNGTKHPFQNDQGYDVCMNEYMFSMLKPLIISQDWVHDYIVYNGQEIDLDLDIIRSEKITTMPYGSINRWLFYVYPNLSCDLSKKWITIPEKEMSQADGKIIINRTQRYFNNYTNYFFLKSYERHLIFSGLEEERKIFCQEWGLDIPLLYVNNFLELAMAINKCRFYIGNQSMGFQIAEGLGKKRILEVFERMPNVIPTTPNGYDFLHQQGLEYFFTKLFNGE